MKTRETEQTFLNLFIDLIILNLAMPIGSWLLQGEGHFSLQEISLYLLHGNLAWIVTYLLIGRHPIFLKENYWSRVVNLHREVLLFALAGWVIALIIPAESFSRRFFAIYLLTFYMGKLMASLSIYYYLSYKRRKDLNTKRVLIVGVNETGRLLRQLIESNPIWGYHFVGFVRRGNESFQETLGTAANLDQLIGEYNIQKVFVTISLYSDGIQLKEFLEICNRRAVRLRFVPEDQHLFHFRKISRCIGNLVMINPQELPLDHMSNRIFKRLFDIVFSSLVVIGIFSWLFPILAILIKLSSRGPVFFMQKRTGINNKTFNCFKFRSMRCNAVADIKQATEHDDRITPIGRFMRKYYIDEIPQFLNVFKGDMSVVGPRPHMLKHTEIYEKLIKDYQVRHFFKPGVTGWAQASGFSGETEELWKMEKRIEYDIEYIQNWTFMLDMKIIWLTVFGRKQDLKTAIKKATIHQEANRRMIEPFTGVFRKAVL